MANNGTKTISKLLIKERQTQLINKKIIYSLRKIKKKKKKKNYLFLKKKKKKKKKRRDISFNRSICVNGHGYNRCSWEETKKKKKTINTIKNNFKLSKSIQINYILELS